MTESEFDDFCSDIVETNLAVMGIIAQRVLGDQEDYPEDLQGKLNTLVNDIFLLGVITGLDADDHAARDYIEET